MKAFAILASFLAVAVASTLDARDQCTCDTSKCPTSGSASCDCITGLLDNCYVQQTNAGIDCGKPVYPSGCTPKSNKPIAQQACGGSSGGSCASDQICYFPDKSCDPHVTNCTGLCASNFCGGDWDKECPDSRWSCVYDDACEKSGATNCDGVCTLN